jgi:uncharacterized protein DUF1579
MKTLVLIGLLAAGLVAVQELPKPAAPEGPHQWLEQLVGEWTAKSEASMGPGTEPIKAEAREVVRSIGGLWTVAEADTSIQGTRVHSILTLGYDPVKQAFVGTWIDSVQAHLWLYRGTLDESKKILTLEAEGPSFDDPNQVAKFRDVIEIASPDRRLARSFIQGPDGNWIQFQSGEYQRKK